MLERDQPVFLDFIRGLAVLLVLFAHAQQIMINPYWYPHKEMGDRDLLSVIQIKE